MTRQAAGCLDPDQFSSLTFRDFPGGTIDDVAARLYRDEPTFMSELEADIAAHGVHEPVELARWIDRLEEGHHRIAAAYRAGRPVPFTRGGGLRMVDEDEQRRWSMRRRQLPEEYAARMAHDPARWREQGHLPQAGQAHSPGSPGQARGPRAAGRAGSARAGRRPGRPGSRTDPELEP